MRNQSLGNMQRIGIFFLPISFPCEYCNSVFDISNPLNLVTSLPYFHVLHLCSGYFGEHDLAPRVVGDGRNGAGAMSGVPLCR